jgi:hypothetical protein
MHKNSSDQGIDALRRRNEQLKKETAQIETRLGKLDAAIKKVTGRIVLPPEAFVAGHPSRQQS